MRRFVLAFIACWFALAVAAAAPGDYERVVAGMKAGGVKTGDGGVDYLALRNAYAESANYQPYGDAIDALKTSMHTAFNAKDCTKVLAEAEKILDESYIDIAAHLLSARCFELGGAPAKAIFHRAVAKGLMDSVVASGDGKSTATAFVVVTVAEEYDVLAALRWRLVAQSLVEEDGHAFDSMEVISTTSQDKAVLFFQIDRPMKWLSGNLGGNSRD